MRAFLTVGCSLLVVLLFATTAADAGDGAVYIRLSIADAAEIAVLTDVVSISDRRGDTLWAYALPKQLDRLRELGYSWIELPYPGATRGAIGGVQRDAVTGALASYPSYDEYVELMQGYAIAYPELCQLRLIGTSQQGRQVLVLAISDHPGLEENEPEIYYSSTMHGNEETGFVLLIDLIEDLLGSYSASPATAHEVEVKQLVDNLEIWINPLANPDGYVANSRYYANFTDPNRDFPDPGVGDTADPELFSASPETLDQMRFADARSIVLGINYHDGTEVVNYPWDTWYARHPDDTWYQIISHAYADACQAGWTGSGTYMTGYDDGITNGYDWYEANGTRQDYMNYYKGAREVTVEVSNSQPASAASLPNYWDAHGQAMLDYMGFALSGIRGIVSDTITGEAVPATVTIVGHDSTGSTVSSDPEVGDYHRMIEAGSWDFQFSAWGYLSASFPDQVVGAGSAAVLDVALTPESDASSIAGVVTDATGGLPVPVATVELVDSPLPPRSVGGDGRYKLTAVMPGSYQMRAAAWGYEPTTVPGVSVSSGGGDLTVDISMQRSAGTELLQGTVTDQSTAAPVEGATVVLVLAPAPVRQSGASGGYDFGPVPAGSWVMACSMEGYHTEVVDNVVVGSGSGNVTQDFALRPIVEVELTGTVTNAETGAAIDGAVIALSGPQEASVVSGAAGAYAVSGLIDGTYQVLASAQGFAAFSTAVVLDDADEQLDLQMQPVSYLVNEDFELDGAGFAASGSWAWGEDALVGAASGTKVWGTVLGANYVDNAHWTLDSPQISIPADVDLAELHFQHWYQTEVGWDGGNVSVSTDGQSWQVISPDGGYPDDDVDGLGNNVDGYSGSSLGWIEASFDLGAYVGQSVVIRFNFGSDSSQHAYRGWYLDDIVVETAGGTPTQIFADGFEDGNLLAWSGSSAP